MVQECYSFVHEEKPRIQRRFRIRALRPRTNAWPAEVRGQVYPTLKSLSMDSFRETFQKECWEESMPLPHRPLPPPSLPHTLIIPSRPSHFPGTHRSRRSSTHWLSATGLHPRSPGRVPPVERAVTRDLTPVPGPQPLQACLYHKRHSIAAIKQMNEMHSLF